VATVRRIVITGPESTGKTTLAERVAEHLATEWVPEAARSYAERVQRDLTAADVEPIAREHIRDADAALARVKVRGLASLVMDTDLASTLVYAEHYYGGGSQWLRREAQARRGDLYLLCDVDVAWVPDGVRDRPVDRAAMLASFSRVLDELGVPVASIRGDWEERWVAAQNAIRTFTETFRGASG
jgi:NadR type nicotinamide-nucleotide adenylyltransferase